MTFLYDETIIHNTMGTKFVLLRVLELKNSRLEDDKKYINFTDKANK